MPAMENASSSLYMDEVSPVAPVFDKNAKFTLRMVVQVFIMVLGVPGNSLIILVYKNKIQKTSTHVFIMTLAMADLSVCLMRVLDIVDEHFREAGYTIGVKAINLLRPLEYTAIGTTTIITALIAADRYDCVCRPLRRFFSRKRAKIAALASLVASLAVNSSALVEEIIDSDVLPLIVFVLAFQLVAYVTVLVLIITCYRLVYITIRKHVQVGIESSMAGANSINIASVSTLQPSINKPGSSTSSYTGTSRGQNVTSISGQCAQVSPSEETAKSKKLGNKRDPQQSHNGHAPASVLQRKTTKMLFIASVVFLLTWLTYWIFVGMEVARQLGVKINPVFDVVASEARSFVYINNIVNPLIYGFSSSRFRKDCQVVLRKIRRF